MTMKPKQCKNCREEMFYNHGYQCYECGKCGKVFNALGQELRPIEDWKEDYDEDDY